MKATTYYRNNQQWSNHLGQTGFVIASTFIRVSSPQLSRFTPYSFVLIQLKSQKIELMGVPGEKLKPGDQIQCVFRKSEMPNQSEVIGYTIKAKKID